MVDAIYVKCDWCEEEATFNGPEPKEELREAGWLLHVDSEGERDYCSLGCCISALNP